MTPEEAVEIIRSTKITEVVIVPSEVFDAWERLLPGSAKYQHTALNQAGILHLLYKSYPIIRGGPSTPPTPPNTIGERLKQKGFK